MAGCASDDGDASDGDASDGDFLEAFAGRGAGDASSAGPSSFPGASAHSLYTSAFVNPKAGMDGVDTAHVRRVVDAMSRNSAHHRNETRKLEKVEARIREMRARFARLTPEQLARHQRRADARVATLERTRDVSRTWIHVDMDAFYAAVHVLENPELGRVPIAVGGVGMISTANYVARAFGVRSAMPGFIALKLCPDLTFVKPDFEKYRRYANLAREVFREYDPNFDAVSLDEAFLDVTEYLALNGVDANAAASAVRAKVRVRTGGLTCSAGVAPNRRLAKVCSDANKPDGQMVLANDGEAIVRFVRALPVRKIGGVGKVQERVLAAFGMTSCGDVFERRASLAAAFSETAFEFLLAASMGVGTETREGGLGGGGEAAANEEVARKSVSQERTFAPTSDRAELERKIADAAKNVAASLEQEGLLARVATVKMKRATFEVTQRQASLERSHARAKTALVDAALRLFRAEKDVGALRLVGVKASGLVWAAPERRLARSAASRRRRDGRRGGAGGGGGLRATTTTRGPPASPTIPGGARDVRVRVRADRRGGGPRRARGLALRARAEAESRDGIGSAPGGAGRKEREEEKKGSSGDQKDTRARRRAGPEAEDAVRRLREDREE
jgi:DNA polymerase kappa